MTETEEELLAIWRRVGQHDDVGLSDTLLSGGGTSVTAIRIANAIAEHFGYLVSLDDLLSDAYTVADLGALIDRNKKAASVPKGGPPHTDVVGQIRLIVAEVLVGSGGNATRAAWSDGEWVRLSSLSALRILSLIEARLAVQLEDQDLSDETFASFDNLVATVQKRVSSDAGQ